MTAPHAIDKTINGYDIFYHQHVVAGERRHDGVGISGGLRGNVFSTTTAPRVEHSRATTVSSKNEDGSKTICRRKLNPLSPASGHRHTCPSGKSLHMKITGRLVNSDRVNELHNRMLSLVERLDARGREHQIIFPKQ